MKKLPHIFMPAVILALPFHAVWAQIGDHTASEGDFVLEDAEDLDLIASGVGRQWIPDYVFGVTDPLQAVAPAGLTLAPGQSPQGIMQLTTKESAGFIDYSFGVPIPSVYGASTATFPGNIVDFQRLDFVCCYQPAVSGNSGLVVLESYPETTPGVYPKAYWNFTPEVGDTFSPVSVDLHQPDYLEDNGSLTIDQMLAQTRYLAIYFYAEGVATNTNVVYNIDDITLKGPLSAESWYYYD